jgi:pyruvate,water dikinase
MKLYWQYDPERERTPPDHAAGYRHRYEGFRNLLDMNSELLELLADLEADLRNIPLGEVLVRDPILRLLDGTRLLADTLNVLTDGRFSDLYEAHGRIEEALRGLLGTSQTTASPPIAHDLSNVGTGDEKTVGGKAASLGAVKAALPEHVPDGFVIGTQGYWLFMRQGDVWPRLRRLLADLDVITNHDLFCERTRAIREVLAAVPVPESVTSAIQERAASLPVPRQALWAVRSSGVGEDGTMTFAGQFESFLNVPGERLVEAYRSVLVSRFSDRAVRYRLAGGFREVDTPMAVLFLPMLSAWSAGVMYTQDPQEPAADRMLINSTWGLADRLVGGRASADTFFVRRSPAGELIERQIVEKDAGEERARMPSLTEGELLALGCLALAVEGIFGRPQDIEWVLDDHGKLWVVQSRPLRITTEPEVYREAPRSLRPLLEGGMTIAPGRAAGLAYLLSSLEDLASVKEGAVLVVSQAVPELSAVLPLLAGLITAQGNPAGHLAALLREFGIPSLFGLAEAPAVLSSGQQVGLDATARKVYEGTPWPEVRERVMARLKRARERPAPNPLHDLVLRLNLTDPMSLSFRPSRCRSLHDIIRFCHEKAVAALFDTSDRQVASLGRRPLTLKTGVSLPFVVLDLGGSIDPESCSGGTVAPDDIRCRPFQALWRGVTTPGVSWAGRPAVSLRGFASVVMAQQASVGPRALGDHNYIVVSPDYLNMNTRLAYHFAMIDAWVEDTPENNFVNFRFRGGGASAERRDLRVRFLKEVLLRSGFGVDRRGDLVTAWLRRYPRNPSEDGLTLLGQLMGCARQLDMLMDGEAAVKHYVERFLRRDYQAFG